VSTLVTIFAGFVQRVHPLTTSQRSLTMFGTGADEFKTVGLLILFCLQVATPGELGYIEHMNKASIGLCTAHVCVRTTYVGNSVV